MPDMYIAVGWAKHVRVEHTPIEHAPDFLRGLRIVFISDIHLRKSVSDVQLQTFIDRISAEHPDCVLLGGDYGEGKGQPQRLFSALSKISAPLGIFGCVGNNDRECDGSIHRLRRMVKNLGIHLLINNSYRIKLGSGELLLFGADDQKYGIPWKNEYMPRKRMGQYRILLSHYPLDFGFDAERAPDLILSGHTHGGQWNIFGITPYVLPMERSEFVNKPAWICGSKMFGNTRMIVSSGIGYSRSSLRIGARPRIHVLTFGAKV